MGADSKILEWVHSFSTTFMDKFAVTISNAGSAEVVVLLTLVIVGYLASKKRRRNAALVCFGVGGAAVTNVILKMLFQRERPELWPHLVTESGYSFPSGHAMASSALAFSLVFILWHTKWRWVSILLAGVYVVAIGFSRLYLGVHYPSDIVAGWCVSFAWVLIVYMNLHWALPPRRQRRVTEAAE